MASITEGQVVWMWVPRVGCPAFSFSRSLLGLIRPPRPFSLLSHLRASLRPRRRARRAHMTSLVSGSPVPGGPRGGCPPGPDRARRHGPLGAGGGAVSHRERVARPSRGTPAAGYHPPGGAAAPPE